jgi:outer membrane protein assembly factor BamB
VGPGHFESIVTSGEAAYVGSDDGSVYAFSGASCTPLWQSQMHLQQAGIYTVSGGLVYVSDAIQPSPVYALSASTGKVLWQFDQPGAIAFRVRVQDGVLFVEAQFAGDHYSLTALRARDGHVLWQDAQSPSLQMSELLGSVAGVVYNAQMVGQDPEIPTTGKLLALNAGDGRGLWTATLVDSDGGVTISLVESNGVLFLETSTGALYALQARSGIQLWHVPAPQQGAIPGGPSSILKLVVANGLVYAGRFDGVAAYRATDGSVVWRYRARQLGPFPSTPALVSGVIFVGTGVGQFGYLVALNASDGTVMWKQQDDATPNFGPMLVEGNLLIGNGNTGPAYALHTSDGTLAWRSPYMPEGGWYTSFGPPEALDTDSNGSGVVYIGSADGLVHALDVKDGRQLWQAEVK